MFDLERLDTSLIALLLAKCQSRHLQGSGFAINVLLQTIPHFVIEDAQIVPMRNVTCAYPGPELVWFHIRTFRPPQVTVPALKALAFSTVHRNGRFHRNGRKIFI
jgi:hypothetical protein